MNMSLALPDLTLPAHPSLAEQLLCLRRRWRIVLGCTLVVFGITSFVLAHLPLTYTATGMLLYAPEQASVPDRESPPALTDQDAVTASQTEMIASLPVARALVTQLDLAAQPGFSRVLRPAPWPLSLFEAPAGHGADALAAAARRALHVAVEPGSDVLAVSFTAENPALAAAAANLAMRLYLDHERQDSYARFSDAQSWLQEHAAAVQAGLDETETQLAKARAAAGVVQGAQASLTTETASQLTASLVQAQASLALNQAQLVAAARDTAAIAPNLELLRKEQADLAAQVGALQDVYGADYPDLRTTKARFAAITAQIDAATARAQDAARADVAADRADIATLQKALTTTRSQSQTEDADSGPVRALEQRAEAGQAMLRSIALQSDLLAQDVSLTRPDARILSTAAVPTTPSAPNRFIILAASLALGLCGGLLLAGLADALDTSFRSGIDVREQLGLSCLALVPEIPQPQQAGLEAPFSLFAEQLRALRAGLHLGTVPRLVAVIAARPAEGKTTLTIAFARALASSGLRVLAIDGDIRQPGFNPVFNVGGAPGFTDHLAGLAALDDVLLPDPLSPLTVLPAGTQAKAALSLFLSPALDSFMAQLRESWDVVLLDVPPVFALAEGRVLARMADCALLCIRWGDTPRHVVQAAMTLLREAGVTLAGAVLTRVKVREHSRSGFADAEIYQPRYGGYFR
ncbi:polysaccharide biosynthesis tyrosine autokinase [Acidocella sp.]|jgi:succinoglycan biosynthesis transport protein ExoP|uniref:polysaccharide biosynthesis tyrosine autokinase n=1 Tax=Acidocella sp. TaxID=50710 RepID=UPI002D7E1766|nr:AAA family ATPase [Acidocella sp.]